MTCQEVIAKLEELSPVKYASDWDNVGLLAGRAEKTDDLFALKKRHGR